MEFKKNNIPTSDSLSINYEKLKNVSTDTHIRIRDSLNSANVMYNNSSASEDMVVEDFLSVYTDIKDIDFKSKNRDIVKESFLTTKYADSSFVTKSLNIDTQNGNIILPVISSTNLPIRSTVIESLSNGKAGNSFNNMANSDLSVILTSDSQELFEYENVSTSTDNRLILSMSLNLTESAIVNGIYIKLFAYGESKYPVLDIVEVTNDGVNWITVEKFDTSKINKSDFFIRFLPMYATAVRVKLVQDTSDSIKTAFGYRYRSSIGIREITVKRIEYDNTGGYVSIPFSTGKQINSVTFNYIDISNDDIKYSVSGNNGSKWIDIKEQGETVSVINEDLDDFNGESVKSVRVKVEIDKTNSIINKINAIEYSQIQSTNTYTFLNSPDNIDIEYGNHISFGRNVMYNCEKQNIQSDSFILRGIPYMAANLVGEDQEPYLRVYVDSAIKDASTYTIEESTNPSDCVLKFTVPLEGVAQVAVDFREVVYTPSLVNNVLNGLITDTIQLPTNMFYFNESDIIVKENGKILSQGSYKTIGRDKIQIRKSEFSKDSSYTVSYIPSFKATCSITKIGNDLKLGPLFLSNTSRLLFNYTYKSILNSDLIKYYTPIGLEYSMEIK